MLLATILLLCPFPQIEGTAKAVANDSAAVSPAIPDSTSGFFALSAVAVGTGAQSKNRRRGGPRNDRTGLHAGAAGALRFSA